MMTGPDSVMPNNTLNVVVCNGCGLGYLSERVADLSALNNAGFYESMTNEEEEAKILQYQGMIEWYEKYAPGGRFLDIGCGRGLVLKAASNRGWDVIGVETDPISREAALKRGLHVAADIREIGVQFDLVMAWHVLEHVTDPISFLKAAFERVKPGGVFAMQVPSLTRHYNFVKRGISWTLICAAHPLYWSAGPLRQALTVTGFNPVEIHEPEGDVMLTAIARRLSDPGELHLVSDLS